MAKIGLVEPGPHEWLKTTQIIVLWLKTTKKLVWDIFRHDLMGFRAEKNFDFFRIFKVPVQDFGSGSKFSSSTVRHQKCLKLPQTCQMTLLGRIDPKKIAEQPVGLKIENSTFGPIQWQTWISRKSASGTPKPDFSIWPQKHLPTGFFCRTRLKTNIYVFSSDSIAVWALVHDQTCENVENPWFWLFFEKVDFWRFWGSGTTWNNGDVQFLVAKSCLAQVFRPRCQV